MPRLLELLQMEICALGTQVFTQNWWEGKKRKKEKRKYVHFFNTRHFSFWGTYLALPERLDLLFHCKIFLSCMMLPRSQIWKQWYYCYTDILWTTKHWKFYILHYCLAKNPTKYLQMCCQYFHTCVFTLASACQ